MPELDMIEVVEIAKNFAIIAGWGWFRLITISIDSKKKEWTLTARVGAYEDKVIEFKILDTEKKVISYGVAKEPNNQ